LNIFILRQILFIMASSKYILSLALLSNLGLSALANKLTPRVCDDTPTFLLSDFSYDSSYSYSAPSKLAKSSGQVTFSLSNSAGEYDLDCEANSTKHAVYFDGLSSFGCVTQDSYEPTPFSANFTFLRPSNKFEIKAEWGCFNFATRNYETYVGTANGTVPLVCDDRKFQNKNWTAGAIYESGGTGCETTDAEVYPTVKLVSAKPIFKAPPKAPAAAAPKAPAPPKAPAAAPPKAPVAALPKAAAPPKVPAMPKVPAALPKAAAPPPKGVAPKLPPPSNATSPPVDEDDDDDDSWRRRHTAQRRRLH